MCDFKITFAQLCYAKKENILQKYIRFCKIIAEKKQSKATEISKLQALSSRENDPFKRLAK